LARLSANLGTSQREPTEPQDAQVVPYYDPCIICRGSWSFRSWQVVAEFLPQGPQAAAVAEARATGDLGAAETAAAVVKVAEAQEQISTWQPTETIPGRELLRAECPQHRRSVRHDCESSDAVQGILSILKGGLRPSLSKSDRERISSRNHYPSRRRIRYIATAGELGKTIQQKLR